MRIPDLELSRYVARWAPTTSHVLCSSDVAAWSVDELLALAGEEERARWGDLRLGYGDAAGGVALRAAVARRYQGFAPGEVACFAGVGEAIFTMVNLLLEPGDHAIAVWPGYAGLHEVARATGADLTLLPLDHADGWAFPVDGLARALRRRTRLVILNPPHNPTGALPDEPTFRRVVAMARDAGARVLCDESHRLLEHDPRDLLPAAAEVADGAISLAGLSKPFGLAGLRVGWAVTRDRDLLARAGAFRDYLSGCVAAPSEHLATIALGAGDRILARSRRVLAGNRGRVEQLLARRPDLFSWTPPRGGSTGFVRLNPAIDVGAFADRLRAETGVLVLPGHVYGDRGNHFRIGFGGAVTDALGRIGRFADTWPPTALART